MAEIRIAKVFLGNNEEGVPMYGPASQPPERYAACEITETEYVYQVPDREGE